MRTKHSGLPTAITVRKELVIYQALLDAGVPFIYQQHMPFAACGLDSETKHARLDFVTTKVFGYAIVELDEDQHRSYDVSCDVRWDSTSLPQ